MSLARSTVTASRVLLIGIALGFLGIAARDHLIGASAKEWPATEGTVLESYVVRGGGVPATMDTLTPVVNYEYRVSGKRYVSSTVRIGDYLPWAPARVQAYPEARQVRVYYDPTNPQRAVLDPAYPLSAVVTFIAVALGSLVCALYVRSIHAFFLDFLVPKARKARYGSDI